MTRCRFLLVVLLAQPGLLMRASPARQVPSASGGEVFAPGDVERDGCRIFYFSGTPRQIGLRHGRVLRQEIHYLHRAYQEKFLKFAGGSLTKPVLVLGARKLKIPDAMKEEMEGIADGCGLPYDEILLANTFFDMKKMLFCTTVAAQGADGFFARNLDFPGFGVLHKHTVVFSLPGEKGTRMAFVTFPSLVGSLSGINSRGLACAVMEVYGKGYRWDAEPYAMAFRRLLASKSLVKEAHQFLKQNPTTTGNNLMVCDATGDAGVLEITPGACNLRREPAGRYIYATNHFLSERSTGSRISTIRRILRDDPAPTLDLAKKLLRRTGDYSLNLQAMVFYPHRRTLFLSAGAIPASRGAYTPLGATLIGLGIVPGKRRAILVGQTGELATALIKHGGFKKESVANYTTCPTADRLEGKPEDLLLLALGSGVQARAAETSLGKRLHRLPCLTIVCDGRPGAAARAEEGIGCADVVVANATTRAMSLCPSLAELLTEPPQAADHDHNGTLSFLEVFTALGERLKNGKAAEPIAVRGKEVAGTVVLRSAP